MTLDPEKMARPHVLVVGDVMLDRYIIGHTHRISPEAPVPVVVAASEELRAGGAANVAANVRELGLECSLLSVCGDDAAGKDLAALMAKHRVSFDCVIDEGQRTTQKTRLISGVQQIARIDHDGSVSARARSDLLLRFEAHLQGAAAVIFSDYDKGVLADLPTLLAIAQQHSVPAYVDPKAANPARYKGAFLLKPNAREFQALFGICAEDQIVARAQLALDEMNLEYIVITRGAKGILMVSRKGEIVDHPTHALEVFDVTGAGDTILAALVVGVVTGLEMSAAIEQANVAASIAVSRQGTHVVTRTELEERLLQRENAKTKLVDLSVLSEKLESAKDSGAQIVFTNGCFDVLHAGHVRLLKQAKQLGDILVVGLNSDRSVRRLKGDTRPVNDLNDRAEVLSGLASVDHIVVFDDDTPMDLIISLKPDVLVKGGDYAFDTIIGSDFVQQSGGKVVIVPLLAGRSSTAILKAQDS